MLVVISDIHLGDGTTANAISPTAFELFANRLRETAFYASFRADGAYRPLETLDVLLMGDILDPLHSTLWLKTAPGAPDYARPWSAIDNPAFAASLAETTNAILDVNRTSLEILRRCADGRSMLLPPASARHKPDRESKEWVPVDVRLHYMVGNHDWYYRLPGGVFDEIRTLVIEAMGLRNDATPFPYEAEEQPALQQILQSHRVFARHGDYYDKFNFDRERGRNHATLGDVFTMDVCNRYPVEVKKRYGDRLPGGVIDSLRRITNVRPALATPLWISGQIRRHAESAALEKELKKVWDDLCDEFLQLDFVRELDRAFRFDVVDAMEMVLKISKRTSFETVDELVLWVHNKMSENELSLAENALLEPAFLNNTARFVVYGHTHHHEIIPLDSDGEPPNERSQFYFNSGTWRSYYDLAIKNPREQKFVRYHTFTYLTFYREGERSGKDFEAWSGAFV